MRSRTVYRMMLRLPGGTSTPCPPDAVSSLRPPRIPAPAAVPAAAPRNRRRFMLSSRLTSTPPPPGPSLSLRSFPNRGDRPIPGATLHILPTMRKHLLPCAGRKCPRPRRLRGGAGLRDQLAGDAVGCPGVPAEQPAGELRAAVVE